jgi:hypothetical protein
MSAIDKLASHLNYADPSTYLQRPSSAKTPDVSHLLSTIFGQVYLNLFPKKKNPLFLTKYLSNFEINNRDLFAKDKLSAATIKHLDISSDVDDEYHKRYVKILREVELLLK